MGQSATATEGTTDTASSPENDPLGRKARIVAGRQPKSPARYANWVGRVGVLALFLGVGTVISLSGVAHAETDSGSSSSGSAAGTPHERSRSQQGESLHQIASLLDQHHGSVRNIPAEHGGDSPAGKAKVSSGAESG